MTPTDHIIRARESVRLSLAFDRQREHLAIYLNQDHVDYLRDCAADARVEARKHIAEAIAAGWRQNRRAA